MRYVCRIVIELEISRQMLKKYTNMNWHINPSSGSRGFPGEQTEGETDRRTGMTKLIVAFCNFANVPRNGTAWTVSSCS